MNDTKSADSPAAVDLAAALRARPRPEPELDRELVAELNAGQLAHLLDLLPPRGHA